MIDNSSVLDTSTLQAHSAKAVVRMAIEKGPPSFAPGRGVIELLI
jgi:hypothetical protein